MLTARRLAAALMATVLLVSFAGCGDDDDDDTEAVTDEPVIDEEAAPSDDDLLAFFRSTEATCAAHAEETGNTPVDPALFADATVEDGVVIDGAGTSLLVDPAAGTITGLDGPDGEAPLPYSFSCPPDVYLGTVS
jgi:hypothetical protein